MTYATLEQLREQSQIADTLDDDTLQIALNAAVDAVDDYCNRTFVVPDVNDIEDRSERIYTASSRRRLIVDDLAKLDKVEEKTSRTTDFVEVDVDAYDLHPINADDRPYTELRRESGSWPSGRNFIRVTGWFGWPQDVPDAVVQATLLQASWLAQRKNAAFGIANLPGIDGTTGMRIRSAMDPNAEHLLNAFRRDPTRQPA